MMPKPSETIEHAGCTIKIYRDDWGEYGYMIEDEDGEDIGASCWGFYPDRDDNGLEPKQMIEEAKAEAEAYRDDADEAEAEANGQRMIKDALAMEEARMIEMAEFKNTLFLSDEEKEALVEVLCRVGGDPKNSKRRYIESIREALDPEEEVKYRWRERQHTMQGYITFLPLS